MIRTPADLIEVQKLGTLVSSESAPKIGLGDPLLRNRQKSLKPNGSGSKLFLESPRVMYPRTRRMPNNFGMMPYRNPLSDRVQSFPSLDGSSASLKAGHSKWKNSTPRKSASYKYIGVSAKESGDAYLYGADGLIRKNKYLEQRRDTSIGTKSTRPVTTTPSNENVPYSLFTTGSFQEYKDKMFRDQKMPNSRGEERMSHLKGLVSPKSAHTKRTSVGQSPRYSSLLSASPTLLDVVSTGPSRSHTEANLDFSAFKIYGTEERMRPEDKRALEALVSPKREGMPIMTDISSASTGQMRGAKMTKRDSQSSASLKKEVLTTEHKAEEDDDSDITMDIDKSHFGKLARSVYDLPSDRSARTKVLRSLMMESESNMMATAESDNGDEDFGQEYDNQISTSSDRPNNSVNRIITVAINGSDINKAAIPFVKIEIPRCDPLKARNLREKDFEKFMANCSSRFKQNKAFRHCYLYNGRPIFSIEEIPEKCKLVFVGHSAIFKGIVDHFTRMKSAGKPGSMRLTGSYRRGNTSFMRNLALSKAHKLFNAVLDLEVEDESHRNVTEKMRFEKRLAAKRHHKEKVREILSGYGYDVFKDDDFFASIKTLRKKQPKRSDYEQRVIDLENQRQRAKKALDKVARPFREVIFNKDQKLTSNESSSVSQIMVPNPSFCKSNSEDSINLSTSVYGDSEIWTSAREVAPDPDVILREGSQMETVVTGDGFWNETESSLPKIARLPTQGSQLIRELAKGEDANKLSTQIAIEMNSPLIHLDSPMKKISMPSQRRLQLDRAGDFNFHYDNTLKEHKKPLEEEITGRSNTLPYRLPEYDQVMNMREVCDILEELRLVQDKEGHRFTSTDHDGSPGAGETTSSFWMSSGQETRTESFAGEGPEVRHAMTVGSPLKCDRRADKLRSLITTLRKNQLTRKKTHVNKGSTEGDQSINGRPMTVKKSDSTAPGVETLQTMNSGSLQWSASVIPSPSKGARLKAEVIVPREVTPEPIDEEPKIDHLRKNKKSLEPLKRRVRNEINDRYDLLFMQNIPEMSGHSNFERRDLHKLYAQFKVLIEDTATRHLHYDPDQGIDIAAFRQAVREHTFEHPRISEMVFYSEIEEKEKFIRWPQFLKIMSAIHSRSVGDKIDLFFKVIDTDGNGLLSWEEILEIAKMSLERFTSISEDDEYMNEIAEYFTQLIFEAVDVDPDKEIPMKKIKDAIIDGSDVADLLCMFCCAEEVQMLSHQILQEELARHHMVENYSPGKSDKKVKIQL